MFQERFFLFVKCKTYDHNCLAEKYKTKAPQWKNLLSTFWHKIVKESLLFGLLNEFREYVGGLPVDIGGSYW